MSLLLFTDLDGTLIDHHTYEAGPALAALPLLRDHGVALIFCSSKTFSEQRFIQDQLGIVAPFILENGSAVAVPQGYFPAEILERYGFETHKSGYAIYRFAKLSLSDIRAILADFPEVSGFSDASDDELETFTGLSGNALQRARERWATETLLTPLDEEEALRIAEKLKPFGLSLSRGGRFYTVQSAQADKGKAVKWLAAVFADTMSETPVLAAIGDSSNDLPMLAAVHHAFLVQRHDGSRIKPDLPGIRFVEGIGPAGFMAAVQLLLKPGELQSK